MHVAPGKLIYFIERLVLPYIDTTLQYTVVSVVDGEANLMSSEVAPRFVTVSIAIIEKWCAEV